MADSHRDDEHLEMNAELILDLTRKADEMTARGMNQITAGGPSEVPLFEKQIGDWFVRRLPLDPDCLRVSIGKPHVCTEGSYVVIRGEIAAAIRVMEKAISALRDVIPTPRSPTQ